MKLAVLGSGSRGNALVVASGGELLLIDAGFSCRRIEQSLQGLGEDPEKLGGLLLTHEHSDHVRGTKRLVKRHELQTYATAGTFGALSLPREAAPFLRTVRSGKPFTVCSGQFLVEAFRLPHDAREPVGFVVEDRSGCRVGVASDLGSRSRLAWGRLNDLDALVIETNHDLQMLRDGPYPWHLKQRVASRHGHLSNNDAALGVEELVSDRLRHVVCYHLSQTNNDPALAAQAVGEKLDRLRSTAELTLTRQDETTEWLEVRSPPPRAASGQVQLTLAL